MGSPNSVAFCRVHDAKYNNTIGSLDDLAQIAQVTTGLSCMSLIEKFPNEQFSAPMKAFIGFTINPNFWKEHEAEYRACVNQYGNDLGQISDALHQSLLPYVDSSEIGPQAELIVAFFEVMWGANGIGNYRESSCLLLDRILSREGPEAFQAGSWITLAEIIDFEPWHDAKYGNHIEGLSQYFGKDEHGNPLPDNKANSGTTSGKSGGCYVATAVYGSYDCPEVWTLRRFRDQHLAKTVPGRLFIRMYYATSPTIVRLFGETEGFTAFWRNRLDKIVIRLKQEGYQSTPYND